MLRSTSGGKFRAVGGWVFSVAASISLLLVAAMTALWVLPKYGLYVNCEHLYPFPPDPSTPLMLDYFGISVEVGRCALEVSECDADSIAELRPVRNQGRWHPHISLVSPSLSDQTFARAFSTKDEG